MPAVGSWGGLSDAGAGASRRGAGPGVVVMWPPGDAPFPELRAGRARVRSPDGVCALVCVAARLVVSHKRLTNLPPVLSAAPLRGMRTPQRDAI